MGSSLSQPKSKTIKYVFADSLRSTHLLRSKSGCEGVRVVVKE